MLIYFVNNYLKTENYGYFTIIFHDLCFKPINSQVALYRNFHVERTHIRFVTFATWEVQPSPPKHIHSLAGVPR